MRKRRVIVGIVAACAVVIACAAIYAKLRRVEPDWALTPPRSDHVELKNPGIPLEVLTAEVHRFLTEFPNTEDGRRDFCMSLLRDAGYEPNLSAEGDVWCFKEGRTRGVVNLGAHYDKVADPSQGILDNLLGCIIVAEAAHVLGPLDTRKSYLFVLFTDEEQGRKIPHYLEGAPSHGRPEFVVSVDYVGDKYRPLCARWLSAFIGYTKAGISLSSFLYQPGAPAIMHTDQDQITNVDFDRFYLAYQTTLAMIEGIEETDTLRPLDTVLFSRKDPQPEPLGVRVDEP